LETDIFINNLYIKKGHIAKDSGKDKTKKATHFWIAFLRYGRDWPNAI